MKKKKAYFNWKCPHCEHRNQAMLNMEFEMPRYYSVEWECDECGKLSKLEWNLAVNGWPERRRPPKLRKRKSEKKKLKCEHDWVSSTDHPGGELFWKCKKCKKTKEFTEQNYNDEDVTLTESYKNDLRRRGLGI